MEGLTVKQVAAMLNVDVRTIWRWCRNGTLPQPIHITSRTTRWNRSVVEQWIESHQSANDRDEAEKRRLVG